MKLINSLGFLFIGGLMYSLPQLAPGLCTMDEFGFSVRATWLHVMGLLQIGIGASAMLRKLGVEFGAWLESWPEMVAAAGATGQRLMVPDLHPEPEGGLHAFPSRVPAEPMGELIPVEFKPAWAEQQHAA
ncbi:MAG TPA: hypothetical protein VHO24_00315 [Opitutaceae bacterium]|nr:hypothetical protein [Opitutaceae bacterium]